MTIKHVCPLLLITILWPCQILSKPINILVPAYANPCCDGGAAMWNSLTSAAGNPGVNISVILNPASGPGNTTDSNFINDQGEGPLADFRNAGGHIYGYIATNFANRNLTDVQADVDKYYDTLYSGHIDGIFFDEMSNDLAKVGYYQTISDYVHSKDISDLVISNPGTSFTSNITGQANYTTIDYVDSADVLMIFENTGAEYFNNYTPSAWVNDFSSAHFAHVIHNQADWNIDMVDLAIARNAGYVYFSDGDLPNPYDNLASYWDQHVSDIAALNTSEVPVPGSLYLFISGLAFLGTRRIMR